MNSDIIVGLTTKLWEKRMNFLPSSILNTFSYSPLSVLI